MKRVAVNIVSAEGDDREVVAWTSLTPGLVVHASVGSPGWVVTHERSGSCVAFVDDPETAQALAAALGPDGWERKGVDILADAAFSRTARDTIRSFDADNFVKRANVTRRAGALNR